MLYKFQINKNKYSMSTPSGQQNGAFNTPNPIQDKTIKPIWKNILQWQPWWIKTKPRANLQQNMRQIYEVLMITDTKTPYTLKEMIEQYLQTRNNFSVFDNIFSLFLNYNAKRNLLRKSYSSLSIFNYALIISFTIFKTRKDVIVMRYSLVNFLEFDAINISVSKEEDILKKIKYMLCVALVNCVQINKLLPNTIIITVNFIFDGLLEELKSWQPQIKILNFEANVYILFVLDKSDGNDCLENHIQPAHFIQETTYGSTRRYLQLHFSSNENRKQVHNLLESFFDRGEKHKESAQLNLLFKFINPIAFSLISLPQRFEQFLIYGDEEDPIRQKMKLLE